MKQIVNIVKSFMVAFLIIYLFNKMAVVVDIYIPINIFTLFTVGILEIPGLILLIVLKLLI